MPRQSGVVKKERRIGIVIFYKMRNGYYMRVRSRLSSERVKTGKEFKTTMVYANRMATASRLAASIYRQLPPGWKLHSLYRKLTGAAMLHLKEGIDPDQVLRNLQTLLYQLGYRADITYQPILPSAVKFSNNTKYKQRSCTSTIKPTTPNARRLFTPALSIHELYNHQPKEKHYFGHEAVFLLHRNLKHKPRNRPIYDRSILDDAF